MSTNSSPETKRKKGPAFQPNLFAFFASNVRTPPKKKNKVAPPQADEEKSTDNQECLATIKETPGVPPSPHKEAGSSDGSEIPPLLVPTATPTPRNITWQSLKNEHILMRRSAPLLFGGGKVAKPRSKVAAFDMDGTLVVWRCSGYPSNLSDYEVWNRGVFDKMRDLYENQGYQLLLISNQGFIQKAHTGKTAQRVQNLMNFIAEQVGCPLPAIMSTMSPKKSSSSYHKPNPKLFEVAKSVLRAEWDLKESFFVGDSEDLNDHQGGVDRRFAQNVGLQFYTPDEYFGPSDASRRHAQANITISVPIRAIRARAALLGGYWEHPILMILCGVQGSGKTTFAEGILRERGSSDDFIHLSQDILKQREKVEQLAREGLATGKTVIVDRMHLTRDQRESFLRIGTQANVPVHFVLFSPPSRIIAQRVEQRTNHPGKVQGKEGAQLALRSVPKLVLPTYEEDEAITLISKVSKDVESTALMRLYAKLHQRSDLELVKSHISLSEYCQMPRVVLGTMKVGKRVAKETILLAAKHGFRAVDTAPTYSNEEYIGQGLLDAPCDFFSIAKIPKNATSAIAVRESLRITLDRLQRSSVHLLLLHWPSDVISQGTLVEVWRSMEECHREGKCKTLGVCNFNAAALSELLLNVTIPPVVNQVERHPFLPQIDLLDFCVRHDIHLQAHTPLGQGSDDLLSNDVVVTIAGETNQSSAGVVLQWNLQQGVSIVPKCQSEIHMKEIFSCKALSSEQMKRLDGLGARAKRFVAPPFMFGKSVYCWGS